MNDDEIIVEALPGYFMAGRDPKMLDIAVRMVRQGIPSVGLHCKHKGDTYLITGIDRKTMMVTLTSKEVWRAHEENDPTVNLQGESKRVPWKECSYT